MTQRKQSLARLIAAVRPPWSSTALIIFTAVFVALFANTSFFLIAAKIYLSEAETLPFASSLFVFITAIFVLILAAVCHRAFVKPALIIFLLLSSVIAYFMNQYGVVIDHRMIENVLETDLGEARDLFSFRLLLYIGLLGVAPAIFVYRLPLKAVSWRRELLSRIKLAGIAGAFMIAVFFTFSAHYTSSFRTQRDLWARANPAHAIFSAGKLARVAIKSRSFPALIVGADAEIAEADSHKELVVVVVGESARADHFSLNGYERPTNPLLSKENVINFPDFWSCGTSTAHSVPCIFSHYTRTEFDTRRAAVADNALDILKRAGVTVVWRDNNSSSKGVADRVLYENFQYPDKNPVCDTECRDEGMLRGLQAFIDSHPGGDILIVLHQKGNHGPAYYKRYPAAFEKFTPVCKNSDLGSCSSEEVVNAYDNAILYTDYFLARVIALLKQNDDEYETAMAYASDHGESLGENGVYLHALPYFIAPDTQKHVAFIMWFGRNFDRESLANIGKKRAQRLSHDNIFATLLGLFEIRSATYDPKMDILDHSRESHW